MIYIIFQEYFLNKDIQKYSILKENKNIKFINIFWKKNINNYFFKIIRKIIEPFGLNKYFLNYDELKKKKITKYDKVIYFDFYKKNTLSILRKYTYMSEEIFWLWNKTEERKINYLKSFSKNIWTFDEGDGKKYNLKYTNQFYWREAKNEDMLKEEKRLFFIGEDKGRIDRIDEIAKKVNLPIKILIKKEKFKFYKKDFQKYLLKKNLDYPKVLDEIKSSSVILEICKKGQEGITLRALEALFFNKKLITNNLNIKNYDFYNENNIFIIENNKNINKKDIDEFLIKDKVTIKKDILNKYTIENWIDEITKK